MMKKYLLYFCLVELALLLHVAEGFDYKALMQKYYLLCGADYFCYNATNTHQFDVSPNYEYRQICPNCECDYACVRRGDCCPDVFFKFPALRCVNRTIIKAIDEKERDQQYSELMVTTCPAERNENIRQKCEAGDTISRLQNFPVTARNNFALTYYNKYCAECHGVDDVYQWSLDINCNMTADFNYLSTLEEVILLAFEHKCIFQTYLPKAHLTESLPENCDSANIDELENKTLFTKCNETGLWEKLDPDIKYACESSFRGVYRIFKNVFCYMCNPSVHKTYKTTDQCNVTGQWDDYDVGLERACSELPPNSATLPYKNIFCYLCNKGNDSNEQFVDIKSTILEYPINDTVFHYQYEINITGFNLFNFALTIERKMEFRTDLRMQVNDPFSQSTIRTKNGSSIDIANLIHQSIALDPRRIGVCAARRSLFPLTTNVTCDCDPSCIFFNYNNCCADLALELSTTCREHFELSNTDKFLGTKSGYSTINGCFQESTYGIYKNGCTNTSNEDVYSLLPVDIPDKEMSYNNLYCVLCNLKSSRYTEKLNEKTTMTNNETDEMNDTDVYTVLEDFVQVENRFLPWESTNRLFSIFRLQSFPNVWRFAQNCT